MAKGVEATGARAHPARSPLRERAFLRLWSAATAAGPATWALPLVLGLAVLEGTLSPAALGLTVIAPAIGAFGAGPVLGGCALVPTARHFSRRPPPTH
ncbi:hypothetical protein [Streptomyces litchfieldiae]|uniref:Uncharacterized protein n=1 Tax=Streptomyces litchfieldiae TaxID=3075543 RepID=A0ABU2MZF9_9ACTN|nr:hypothetical protein [Streptomyces sp. DSM 44938]MDT0346891.1 hypothetical protein [Streptomyces sp. DSM 44938]